MGKDARIFAAAVLAACALSLGANWRTQNFVLSTNADRETAQELCETAERCRSELAIEWLGSELENWSEPCPVTVNVSPQLGAGGATSFMFNQGRPFGWKMDIQGSKERLLDSVIPHEVTHTIFATHFGRPLPRWADEGACTTVEADVEKEKQKRLLIEFLKSGRGIPFNRMFAMKEYPADIMPLYSQGFALARFLIAQGGKRKYVAFVGEGMRWNNWPAAVEKHYGYENLSELQLTWNDWVRHGSPSLDSAPQFAGRTVSAEEPVSRSETSAPGELSPSPEDEGLVAVPHGSIDSPRAGGPAAEQIADLGASQGWYAQQRDLARSGEAGFPPLDETFSGSNEVGRYQPGSIGRRLPFRMAGQDIETPLSAGPFGGTRAGQLTQPLIRRENSPTPPTARPRAVLR